MPLPEVTPSDSPTSRIEVREICKSYYSQVLQDVSLTVGAGRIHGLVGENGAGKTTLAKIIVGLEAADSGELFLDGKPFTPVNAAESLEAGVALCAQELSLVPDLSVSENILIHTSTERWRRIRRKSADANARMLLDRVGLENISPSTLVSKLSLAEKQLVELAKTLATKANLLVLDEPTSALTGPQSDRLHAILRELTNVGVSVIYISHRLADVLEVCDQVSVLRDGKVLQTKPSTEWEEKTLIREMAGVDADFDAGSNTVERDAPVRLVVENLCTEQLPHAISFSCKRGEILGIAGLAGSGRTELLNAIFGLDKRIGGSIKIHSNGEATEIRNVKQAIRCGTGMVAEDRSKDGIFRDLTLGFNITVAGLERIANRIGKVIRERETGAGRKLLEDLRVRSTGIEQKIRELSGGNQQKLMLGRWLHCESQLLLLDEPTRGVDVGAKLAIHEELARLRNAGVAVIAVSSELDELRQLCDRILVLSNRKLVATLERGDWSQEDILEAAFSEYITQK